VVAGLLPADGLCLVASGRMLCAPDTRDGRGG